ncbi:MAG TPA: alpha/beta hydrolase [Methylomirabilota bacterium]|nr:alpha/beta hydrolase [Methylomirabilota bacterium]
MYRDEWMSINGVRLHWQDWGAPEAPAVLMLHGLTQQSHTFDHVAERISARYRCIVLDLRGRGESEWAAPETYTIPHYVQDAVKLLDELTLPAVHILGTSLGGLCGLSLGAFHPQRVLSLALNDIGPEIDPAGAKRIATYTATVPGGFPNFEAAVDWARERYLWLRRLPRAEVEVGLRWAVRERDGGWSFKFDPAIGRTPPPTAEVMKSAGEIWWNTLASLRCPILLVRGADSDVLSRATADEMERRQPALVRVEVPDMGHAPMLSELAALAALDRFYKG